MTLVVIESPYAGSNVHEIEGNIAYAILCMRDSLTRGECPFASHLLYAHRGVLNDAIPSERERGIEAGFAWGKHADLTAVYVDRGISPGMDRGVARAIAAGRPIEYRRLMT